MRDISTDIDGNVEHSLQAVNLLMQTQKQVVSNWT